jgi:hypothetical protein
MKHHNKNKELKKKNKEDKGIQIMNSMKNEEKATAIKHRLDAVEEKWNKKKKDVNKKH